LRFREAERKVDLEKKLMPGVPEQPVDPLAARNPELEAALSQWDAQPIPALVARMRAQAAAFGFGILLQTLSKATAIASAGTSYAIVAAAERFCADTTATMDPALEVSRAPAITDLQRLIAVLYASVKPDRDPSLGWVVLQLSALTASSAELAARCYFHVGLLSDDLTLSFRAFTWARSKAEEGEVPDLLAPSELNRARCYFRLEKYKEAEESARFAKELFELMQRWGPQTANVEAAAVIESASHLIESDVAAAAALVRPLLVHKDAGASAPEYPDATMILGKCIELQVRPVMERARNGDIKGVESYDSALALAAETDYGYPNEASDRVILGICLLHTEQPAEALKQFELAESLARAGDTPRVLLNALLAHLEYLVTIGDKQALSLSSEALSLTDELKQSGRGHEAEILRGYALRQAGNIQAAVEHFGRANEGMHGIDFRVPWILCLLEAGRDSSALEATEALTAELCSAEPATIAVGGQHLKTLMWELLKRGHIGPAQHLSGVLQSPAPDTARLVELSGLPLEEFKARAAAALATAFAQQAAGELAAATAALVQLFSVAIVQGASEIALSSGYALGETLLISGNSVAAYKIFQEVANRAKDTNPVIYAIAMIKSGTALVQKGEAGAGIVLQTAGVDLCRSRGSSIFLTTGLAEATETALLLNFNDIAKSFADEFESIGPKYPPQNREWLTSIPARVASRMGNWEKARPLFRATIAELERKRAQFKTASQQRTWGQKQADFYGHAIEGAIRANDGAEAVYYLELARNRYLNAVTHRENSSAPKNADPTSKEAWVHLTAASISDRLPPKCAIVWCIAFTLGMGVVSATRVQGELKFVCRFYPELSNAERQKLFEGDAEIPFWESRGGRSWNQAIEHVVEVVRTRMWPPILAAIDQPVPHIVLLPSFGCSQLPMIAAAPEQWPDQTPLSVSFAPSVRSLTAYTDIASHRPDSLIQFENPTEDSTLVCCSLERRAVGSAFGTNATVLRGRRASASRVAEAFTQSDIVHFMGHAWCDWDEPLNSGLLCAQAPNQPQELRVRDLLAAPRSVGSHLIVLSACEISNVRPGDSQNDFVALPATLLALGARCVISPRWQVDDVAASMLVANLCRRWLSEGASLVEALYGARRWLREEVTRSTVEDWLKSAGDQVLDPDRLSQIISSFANRYQADEHPFSHVMHWGAFELTGDPFPFGVQHG
jgi:tetratricopeptide (TPR) repeat protein